MKKGKVYRYTWLDITESSTGDPEKAVLEPRVSVGHFWGYTWSDKIKCAVFCGTWDEKDHSQQGWICVPTKLVLKTEKLD